jgi:hypothetical protein
VRKSQVEFEGNRVTRTKSFVQNMANANEDEVQLEASSPDEVALVKFGYACKMKLIERNRKCCTV